MAEANEAPEQGKEKKKSTLESVIGELGSFARKAAMLGALAAMPLIYAPFNVSHVPRAAVTIAGFTAGQMAGNLARNESPTKGVLKQGFIGNVLSAPLSAGFYALNSLETAVAANYGSAAGQIAKVGTFLGVHQPTISTIRTGMDYGLGKNFRKYWWPGVKTTFKTIGLLGTINVLWVYQLGLLPQMAYSAVVSFILRIAYSMKEQGGTFKNLYSNLNPLPYAGAATSVSYKLARNTTKGLYDAVYAIGSSIRDSYKSAPTKPAAATSAPAVAPAKS